ncbi:DNA topoisomerase 1b [Acanthamoeba polyphaga mimivirus]|uniref:DNA topoisomerase I n=1 Tax=Acanthamoeba polyphaga mimivirus TaxID=212035 RepID=A0A0G2Y017_MIMIV|nr:DNA topoisomerase 1b [Acanthamoeba polyphaga mimivirus]QTF49099.1 DNA topoisomerase 1b [Mimivirus reunion]WMV61542.1 DNA topoisomerase 1b [Mimivirus sp.]WMV62519.1 DNA topoisomerase 1b [Acanthamoeba polyphaga mimivirus]WMV63496.1 DNA topoisomerase 1b [Mimivirus sp.]
MSYDEKHLMEGIYREKNGDKFIYYYFDNNEEVTTKDIERINKLRIPPAWTNVWVARDPNSPIQAIGTDSKGRKQYRYNEIHIQGAEKEKFKRLYDFIKSIPKLEKAMVRDNNFPFYNKNRVISLMLQMVRDYNMRVGKEVYARQNKSYGISSLRKKHVKISPGVITLNFKGKSGQRLNYTIRNDFYIDGIKMLMKLEGDRLFQYISTDEDGNEKIMRVNDRDLNKYIQENMGSEFTIKDFRTFGANLYFIQALLSETRKRTPKNRKTIKKNIANAFKSTARQLKHTGAVSKKSYVMNYTLELYQNNPEFFIEHKNDDPIDFLLRILKSYRKDVLGE